MPGPARADFGWQVSRHADVLALLNDKRFGHPPPLGTSWLHRLLGVPRRIHQATVICANPPDHSRLRRVVTPLFNAPAAERLRPRMREVATELLGRVLERGRMDLIADYARPFPFTIIAEQYGIPPDRRELVQRLAQENLTSMDVCPRGSRRRRRSTVRQLESSFSALIDERRRERGPDLLSSLIEARERGAFHDDAELLAHTIFLLEAGHSSTVQLVGNAVLALIDEPGAMERLRSETQSIPVAVEELLRVAGPIRLVGRIALSDAEIAGQPIRRGDTVYALLGEANRDPARFPDPERVDLQRGDRGHLAFGSGPHHCAGAAFARTLTQVAIEVLVEHTSNLRRAPGAVRSALSFIEGWEALPVHFDARVSGSSTTRRGP